MVQFTNIQISSLSNEIMCLIFKNTMKSMGEKEKTQYFYCFQNQRMIEEPGNNSCNAVFFSDLMGTSGLC